MSLLTTRIPAVFALVAGIGLTVAAQSRPRFQVLLTDNKWEDASAACRTATAIPAATRR